MKHKEEFLALKESLDNETIKKAYTKIITSLMHQILIGSLCGIMTNVLNCNAVGSEFKVQSHYYIHFQANILGKSCPVSWVCRIHCFSAEYPGYDTKPSDGEVPVMLER